jgi:hypothetical protein
LRTSFIRWPAPAGEPLALLDADRAHLRPHRVAELDAVHRVLDGRGVGEHRDHDLGAVRRLGGAVADRRALDRLGALARAVPDPEIVTRGHQAAAHRAAHRSGPDQGDAHQ